MKTVTLLHKGLIASNEDEKPAPASFFPRIIREFDDSDEPMIYGDY